MPSPAKAAKVPTSLMMRARPAVRMGAKFALLPRWALARFASVSVAELRVEGHIADATLGLCWRAWLKMITGGESGDSIKAPESSESDSACVPPGQLSGCCLR